MNDISAYETAGEYLIASQRNKLHPSQLSDYAGQSEPRPKKDQG
jgi:hypothetical protein